MIEYTKPLIINDKVRIGKVLPDNALEICTFDNQINKDKTSNSVSFLSERNLSQFKMAKDYQVILDQDKVDDNVFPGTCAYSDENDYAGIINLKNSIWKERQQIYNANKSVTTNGTYNTINDIPKTISRTVDGYTGVLTLSNVSVKKTNTAPYTVKDYTETKIATTSRKSQSNNFPATISISSNNDICNGYAGTLKLKGVECVINQGMATIKIDSIISGKINGSFPSTVNKDNKLYLPTGKYIDKTETIETWVKHYGVCRYWGGGGNSSNNYYGSPDYKFNVGGWAAKGYMNGAPAPTLCRYGHYIDSMTPHCPDKYPVDNNGYWDKLSGVTDGIKWTYDIEAAAKYGGSTDPGKGGVVWASQYWEKSGGVWPPPGYENDYLGSNHYGRDKIVSGGSSPIPHSGIICVKNGAQKTSLAGFRNGAGWYNKWFRQVILFYKGLTTKTITIQEGNYESSTITYPTWSTSYKAVYVGKVTKDFYKEIKKDVSVEVESIYDGILTKVVTKYDGKAYYEGVVYKKVFLDNNIKTVNSETLLFVDSDGYLKYNDTKSEKIKSQLIRVTDISKDGIPLLYTNKVKNLIYIPSGPSDTTITDNNYIDLSYDTFLINDIVYLSKITPTNNVNYYKLEILTNKSIGCSDNVTASFSTSENEIVTESLSSQYIYTQNIDYTAEKVDDINFKFKFGKYSLRTDRRRKINFSYIVSTTDGLYTSNPRSANLINKKYALESERKDFLHDKMCISPVLNQDRMTAKEIVAFDNNISVSDLKDKKFVVKVQNINNKVDLYTDSYGNGFVYASTYEDTGTLVNGEYTGTEKEFYISVSDGAYIYNAFYVVLENQSDLEMLDPYSNNSFVNWYARLSYMPFELGSNRNNTNIKATYTINEYIKDNYCSLKIPYKEYTEQPIVLDEFTIKLSRDNILFMFDDNKNINNSYFKLYNKNSGKEYNIVGFDIENSLVKTYDSITDINNLECKYTFVEKTYEYKGFKKNGVFFHLDLNPNINHTFLDIDTIEDKPTYNLFNNTVYLFIKPSKVLNTTTNEVLEDNTSIQYNLYHRINNPEPIGLFDILIGIIALSPTFSILNTKIKKTTSIGGGIQEKFIEINKKHLDAFFDINEYSERAIQKNGTIIIKTSNDFIPNDKLLKLVDKYIPIGILPIIK